MIFTLAFRNLFHDGVRFAGTLIGIGFSIYLVSVQLGLYLGFSNQISAMIEHTTGEIWIVPKGTKSFEEASTLAVSERYTAMATPSTGDVVPFVVGFMEWRRPSGEAATVVVVGTDPVYGLAPWNLVEGSLADLAQADGVIVDETYLGELGIKGRGDVAEIEGNRARVVALTKNIRAFTTTPYVFTTLGRARNYIGIGSGEVTHLMVRTAPGVDRPAVKAALAARLLPTSEVLTRAEFVSRSRNHWLFSTGAGFALIAGAILGLVVGTVIVAQTLYSSTKDHIAEFATLRAIGSTSGYIHKVILCQAMISAVIGFSAAAFAGILTMKLTAEAVLPVIVTPRLLAALLVLTVVMCVVSALAAIAKVTRIDPAVVFAR
ncbi:MAG: ABC transporter permease [Xanthobacteraceae bacterium]